MSLMNVLPFIAKTIRGRQRAPGRKNHYFAPAMRQADSEIERQGPQEWLSCFLREFFGDGQSLQGSAGFPLWYTCHGNIVG